MPKLVYTMNTSLDGYVNDADGRLDWSAPDDEVHQFFNDLESSVGTALYGRRLYETMVYWDTPESVDGRPAIEQEYARVWRAQERIVFSRTLETSRTARTRIERAFDPALVRRLKAEAQRDLSIGGATLAGQALAAGLVDEIGLMVKPVIIGGGTRALPDGLRLDLSLIEERRFASGAVYLHYRVNA